MLLLLYVEMHNLIGLKTHNKKHKLFLLNLKERLLQSLLVHVQKPCFYSCTIMLHNCANAEVFNRRSNNFMPGWAKSQPAPSML